MKTLNKFIFLLLISMAVISCDKNDDETMDEQQQEEEQEEQQQEEGTSIEEFFRASVDGTSFEASTDPASLIGGTLSTSGGLTILAGQGSTNDGKFINFSIVGYTGAGTYATGDEITNPNMIMYGELQGSTAVSWISNGIAATSGAIQPGEIVVTNQTDDMAEGTFSFEGYNAEDMTVKNITQGTFKFAIDD